ncbi:MAG: NUDIX domain-containing protein [Candidatus Binatia bacterium]|nr:NUDIX domain-containing protein [Candidatus Binatia bacterium]
MRQENNQLVVALLQTEHKRGLVWVLPKGHVELHANEKVSDAAGREVREEAGITDLSVQNQLGVTRFKFQAENAIVHKTVHYFLMTTGQKNLTPQAEEGLLDARWFPIDEAIKILAYDTDQDIVSRAKAKMLGTPLSAKRHNLPGRHQPPRQRRNLRIHL